MLRLGQGSAEILTISGVSAPLLRPSDEYQLAFATVKALILAGGAGTRLRPITHTRAKQLVPVANKPILFYGIEAMADAGITEIGVIVGDTRDEVMEVLGDGAQFGAAITYIPQDEPLGLAHCVLIAKDFLGDDDFVMYLGDNLLEQDLAAFTAALNENAQERQHLTPKSFSNKFQTRTDSESQPLTVMAMSCNSSRSRLTRPQILRSSACICSTQ